MVLSQKASNARTEPRLCEGRRRQREQGRIRKRSRGWVLSWFCWSWRDTVADMEAADMYLHGASMQQHQVALWEIMLIFELYPAWYVTFVKPT